MHEKIEHCALGERRILSFTKVKTDSAFWNFLKAMIPKKRFSAEWFLKFICDVSTSNRLRVRKKLTAKSWKETSTDFFRGFSFKIFSTLRELWKLLRGAICFRYVGKWKEVSFIRKISLLSKKTEFWPITGLKSNTRGLTKRGDMNSIFQMNYN